MSTVTPPERNYGPWQTAVIQLIAEKSFYAADDDLIVWSSRSDGKYNVNVIWIAPSRG
jgi:hypothetical protein